MVEIYQSGEEIGFRVSDSIMQQVEQWEQAIDERVFFEQLRTGLLIWQEGEIHPDSFELMQKRYKKHGKIEPYYGCSGCSPSFQFHILPASNRLKLVVKHAATSESIEFASLPFSEGSIKQGAWHFRIKGKELDNLAKWEEWDATSALSNRYIFRFFSCGIGAGCSVKSVETGNEVNITDYDAW